MHKRLLLQSFFEQDALTLARALLGKVVQKGSCVGIIVETEAYSTDPASHAYKITPRSAIMRDTYGHWYVYFTYGMHYCANVTCDKGGVGAVLIRAVEPLQGIEEMQRRRNVGEKIVWSTPPLAGEETRGLFRRRLSPKLVSLTNGPAKFCEAFGITKKQNGLSLSNDFGIFEPPQNSSIYGTPLRSKDIGVSPRIGISAGTNLPWRFFIKNNPFVSR